MTAICRRCGCRYTPHTRFDKVPYEVEHGLCNACEYQERMDREHQKWIGKQRAKKQQYPPTGLYIFFMDLLGIAPSNFMLGADGGCEHYWDNDGGY